MSVIWAFVVTTLTASIPLAALVAEGSFTYMGVDTGGGGGGGGGKIFRLNTHYTIVPCFSRCLLFRGQVQ